MAKAKFIGVYASNKMPSVNGKSTTTKQKRYWFVWEDGWERYRVQLLDAAFQPVEEPRTVSGDEFKRYFEYQPRILVTPVSRLGTTPPREDTVSPIVELTAADLAADTHPLDDSVSEREMEQAAKLDQKLRSEFSVALARWRRGDKITPLRIFETMCEREEGIVPAHKHMFTDFAVDLRKSSLPELAIRHYQKAVQLAPEDSHARFNLARIFYETGDLDKAEEQLQIALELTPDFKLAAQFLDFVHLHQSKRSKDF